MPSVSNMRAPVSLVGCGRSGTTLMTNVFRRHPDFQALGETANVVFHTYRILQRHLRFTSPELGRDGGEKAAIEAIYAMLLRLYPSTRSLWFHKPIMIPQVAQQFREFDDFIEWYWSAFEELFPDARVFSVLREPRAVVESYMSRWKQSPTVAMRNQARTLRMLTHPRSKVLGILHFSDLASRPEASLHALFDRIGVPFHDDCMGAFASQHAPNPDRRAAFEGDLTTKLEEAYERARGFRRIEV